MRFQLNFGTSHPLTPFLEGGGRSAPPPSKFRTKNTGLNRVKDRCNLSSLLLFYNLLPPSLENILGDYSAPSPWRRALLKGRIYTSSINTPHGRLHRWSNWKYMTMTSLVLALVAWRRGGAICNGIEGLCINLPLAAPQQRVIVLMSSSLLTTGYWPERAQTLYTQKP